MRKRRNLVGMVVAAAAESVLAVSVLAGCVQPSPQVIPTAEPSSAPVFASDAAALAAAKKAYVAYLAVSDAVGTDGGANSDRLKSVVTQAWLPTEVKSYATFARTGDRFTGSSAIGSFTLERRDQSAKGFASVVAYACLDLSNAGVVDSEGKVVSPVGAQGQVPLEVSFVGKSANSTLLIMNRSAPWSGQNFCSLPSSSPSS